MREVSLRSGGRLGRTQELRDLAERVQRPQVLRFHRRRFGKLLLHRREDFHPLDRVDAQVGIESHVRFNHLRRIAGLVADDRQKHRQDAVGFQRR